MNKYFPTNNIVNGAYETMIAKIRLKKNPNIFFLNYSENYSVKNFFVVPKHFFVPNLIQRRKPLGPSARRAGWVGCNICIGNLPPAARIFLIKDKAILNRNDITNQWKRNSFLENCKIENRTWLLEIISILERIPNIIFTLSEIYNFEDELKKKFPENHFIKEKMRQQLQVLRDKGVIDFLGKGIYKKGV